MKAVVFHGVGDIRLDEVAEPEIREKTDAIVRLTASAICGTDLHIRRWNTWASRRVHPPLIVGHEMCGEVVEVGERVTTIKAGDFVSAESHIVCGICDQCRTGNAHICENTRILGVDTDGVFAEYVRIPAANAWRNPPDMPWELATLMENFGNAVHTALSFDLLGEDVLITGAGPIGCMASAVAQYAGARYVVVTDVNPWRLELAKRMKATRVVDVRTEKLADVQKELDMKEGFDVGLEMSGNPTAFRDMLANMCHGGKIAMLGIPEHERLRS